MEISDIIKLSLYYARCKQVKNHTPEEIISIGYQAYLLTEKYYNIDIGVKKTTLFMKNIDWCFKKEFRLSAVVYRGKSGYVCKWRVRPNAQEFNLQKHKQLNLNEHKEHKIFENELLYEAYKELSEREQIIIKHKYELNYNKKLTFKALAKKLNLSPQRVRMIHLDAIDKLRSLIAKK